MQTRLMCVICGLVAAVALVAADQNDAARTMLEAARKKEVVDGDLNGAIRQYKAIADKYKSDRAVAADALVRMAAAYEKLGDVEAQKIYQRLLRDYGDQKDAVAIARARLAAPDGAAISGGVALRKLWTSLPGEFFFGGLSPDGRYLTYSSRFNTAVILRDLVTGADRPLTSGDAHGTFGSAISMDGKEVAFDWCTPETCELWISPLQGAGLPSSRSVFANEEVLSIRPHDWSPDGRRIAVSLQRKDRTAQIGWVSVADRSLRVVKSVDWRGPIRMFFSPDGRDIAFDLPASDTTDDRDVFVVAADGSREIAAVVNPGNDFLIGWAPDGGHLLFASDRSGTVGLWALPFAGGKPQGAPRLLKANIGNVFPLRITKAGSLYTTIQANDQDIELVSIDFEAGRQTGPPVKPIQQFTGSNSQPAWSPDGKWLAYVSRRGNGFGVFGSVIAMRSSDTGDIRELRPLLSYLQGLTWSRDGRSFVVFGADFKGRDGVFRIDARTGEVTPLIFPVAQADSLSYEGFFWSPDGQRLYYHSQMGAVHERNLSSGTERLIVGGRSSPAFTKPPDGTVGPISLSPDGRWIAAGRLEASGTSEAVVLIPVDGGEPRALLRVSQPEWINNTPMPWTPDGRAVLVRKMTRADGSTSELWQVPIDGTAPRKLELDVNRVLPYAQGKIQLHPDGHRLAFVSGHYPVLEVWVLENFLPGSPTRASR